MKPLDEEHAAAVLVDELAGVFECAPRKVRVEWAKSGTGYDYSIDVAGRQFVVEYKKTASAGQIAQAIESLERFKAQVRRDRLPLIVVPFMGDVGRRLCEKSHVSWIDLSGNAKIVAPGVRIWIEGRPNKFVERGRPPDVFAPMSSRVARELLTHPDQFQTQAQLAREAGLGAGYVSKIVRRLAEENYLERNDDGAVRAHDPGLLLEAWRDSYDFGRHNVVKGHVPARSGEELLGRIAATFPADELQWAATGLGAAWLYTHFASFRLATVYASSLPARSVLRELEFEENSSGANLWLVLPDDEAVFKGAEFVEGIRCVSAVQCYLDLKAQPERAKDAALELHKQIAKW